MTSDGHAPPGWRERAVALAILAGLVLLAAWVLTAPLRAALAVRAETQERLERYRLIAQEPAALAIAYDPATLAASYPDESNAQLDLQSQLDAQARASMLAVLSLTPTGSEPLGGLGRITWMEATLQGDLQAALDFLVALDRERPVLLVRTADFSAQDTADPDRFLNLRIEVGRLWRPAELAE